MISRSIDSSIYLESGAAAKNRPEKRRARLSVAGLEEGRYRVLLMKTGIRRDSFPRRAIT